MDKIDSIRKALLGESLGKKSFTEEEKHAFHLRAISAMVSALDEAEIEHSDDESEIIGLFNNLLILNKFERTLSTNEALIALAMDTQEGRNPTLSALNFETPDYIKAFAETSDSRFPQKHHKEN